MEERPGEGAFYGPKVDLHVRDALGRAWQMGSVQLDYQLPDRLDLGYIDEVGHRSRPVIVHRALLGSLERFIAILLEHCDGRLPLWLAPEPVRILPVGGEQHDESLALASALDAVGVQAGVNTEGTLAGRIRAAHEQRIPIVAVIGAREAAAGQVAVRDADGQRLVARAELIASLAEEVQRPVCAGPRTSRRTA
jgi:threonyl-tRNA synthetase